MKKNPQPNPVAVNDPAKLLQIQLARAKTDKRNRDATIADEMRTEAHQHTRRPISTAHEPI